MGDPIRTEHEEIRFREYVREMTRKLAGLPWDPGPSPIKPSGKDDGSIGKQVRTIEAKLDSFGVKKPNAETAEFVMAHFLRGAATIGNYAKAKNDFDVQNELIKAFCDLLMLPIKNDCDLIEGPSKKEGSAMKKYWGGGTEDSGYRGEFKDLCRCTIVCYNEHLYSQMPVRIAAELRKPCYENKWRIVPDYLGKAGQKVRKRIIDPTDKGYDEDLGYTDTNISLTLPNGAKVEVQINVQSTLYGKMGRPAFMDEACPKGLGEGQYISMEQSKRVPGGCGHVLYEVWKHFDAGKKCDMTRIQVRTLSRDYYDHLSGFRNKSSESIVLRLTELSRSEIWKATYEETLKDNPRNLPAFRPGNKWTIGLRE